MGTFRIGAQTAWTIQNADVIHNHPGPVPVDPVDEGLRALDSHEYGAAQAFFDDALRGSGYRDPDLLYYWALSALGGVRPLHHAGPTIRAVVDRLTRAGGNATAMTVKALVADDYAQAWRRRDRVPPAALEVIRAVPRARCAEIVRHVNTPESDIWKILRSRCS